MRKTKNVNGNLKKYMVGKEKAAKSEIIKERFPYPVYTLH